jgi:hypothetical protein
MARGCARIVARVEVAYLVEMFDGAAFAERAELAAGAAAELSPEQLAELARHLDHPSKPVRLGVLEVLARANHRASLERLLRHARSHDGDDRVFAIRALAGLARPGDHQLIAAAEQWMASRDPFVEAQARGLARALGIDRGGAAPAARPADAPPSQRSGQPGPAHESRVPGERLERLVASLLAAGRDAERAALVAAIEQRGPEVLVGAAGVILRRAGADAVAFTCRALIRQAAAPAMVAAAAQLVPQLEAAQRRLAESPVACAALEDALLAIDGWSPAVLAQLGRMDPWRVEGIAARMRAQPGAEVALRAPALLAALDSNPALWPALGPVLAHGAPHLRDSSSERARRAASARLAELRRGAALDAVTVVSVCWILARTCEPGEPLPRPLQLALDRLATAESARAWCALCLRLASEAAARALIAMARDPLLAARDAATEALSAWRSPWVSVEALDITTHYRNAHGEPLTRHGDRLIAPGGDDYVLDARGQPIRATDAEFGGCLCCGPPLALVRWAREGLRCPATAESYLRDGARVIREREHPHGRCRRCDSIRPRVRAGGRTICLDCGAGAQPIFVDPTEPDVPSEPGGDADALPRPPSRVELDLIAPHIRAAIVANVFLVAHSDTTWSGSGVIIAREGNHLAIVTNRHVVEDDRGRPCALRALTASGELGTASLVWRAHRGVDLALLEVRVDRPDEVGVIALGNARPFVGAPVFAIGNPLGLAWSYTGGTISAIRDWTTHEGQSVRILQTDAPIAPGSSGGGLFDSEGQLLGVMSFLRQGNAGGSAHFALSLAVLREALARENVRWRSRDLTQA